MATDYNKIITTVNSVTQDYTFIPDQDNVIVIDTSFNRIGINTVNPDEAIHVSGGTIKTQNLEVLGDVSINNISSNLVPSLDISYSLGSSDKQWKDIFVGPGSIYMDGKKVIYQEAGKLIIDNSDSSIIVKNNVTFEAAPSFPGGEPVQNDAGIAGGFIYGTSIGVSANGSLDPSGAYFTHITVQEDSSFNQSLYISNHLTVDGDASFNSNVDILNHLIVTGDTSFNSNVDILNHLTVDGDTSFNSNVDISNHLSVNGDASFNVNVDICNNLVVTGYITGSEALNVDRIITNAITISGDGIVHGNVEISGNLSGTNTGNINMASHIIPISNETYDLGSAEYKIRDLFLSNNSLWLGDEHKVDISDGKMMFKKRNKNKIPKSILDTDTPSNIMSEILSMFGHDNLSNLLLKDWKLYAKTKNVANLGIGNAEIQDIYAHDDDDWEDNIKIPRLTNNSDASFGSVDITNNLVVNNTVDCDILKPNYIQFGSTTKIGEKQILIYVSSTQTVHADALTFTIDPPSSNWNCIAISLFCAISNDQSGNASGTELVQFNGKFSSSSAKTSSEDVISTLHAYGASTSKLSWSLTGSVKNDGNIEYKIKASHASVNSSYVRIRMYYTAVCSDGSILSAV